MSYLNSYTASVVSDPGGTLVISNKVSNALVQRGNQLIALGGFTQVGSTNTATIEMSTFVDGGLSSPGGLAGWTTIGSLPTPVSLHAAVMVGDFIYVIGGMTGTGSGSASSQVLTVRVESNGTVSNLYTELPFPATVVSHAAFAFNNRLYVLAGAQGGTASNACWFCDLGGNGRPVGNWQQTTPLPTNLSLHAAAVTYNGTVMVTGGNDGTNNLANVYTCVIQSNGQLGAWSTQPSMFTPRARHALVNVGNGMYNFGGYDNGGNALSSLEFCDMDPQGRVTQSGWTLGVSSSATLFVPSTTSPDGILFTAKVPGAGGSAISVTFNAPAGGSTTVGVVGNAITVSPATGALNSDVVTAVQGSAPASALVSVAATGPGDAVVAFSTANLSGGAVQGTTLLSATARHKAAVVDNGEKIYLIGGRNNSGTDLTVPQLFKRY